MADTIIKIKEDPIIIRMTGQGVPGRSGPAGRKGDDGITWDLSLIMQDAPNGVCNMSLYKNGELNLDVHYVEVQILYNNASEFVIVPELCTSISGTYTFNYQNARSILATIYEDSLLEKVLCSKSANYGRTATIAVGDVVQGGQASVVNSGTPIDGVFDFVLPKGDAATISVGDTITLVAGSPATVENVGTRNDAILKFGIPNGGGAGARVEETNLIIDAGTIYTPAVSEDGVISWTNNFDANNPPSVRIGINPKGDWVKANAYHKLDVVRHNGYAYMAKKEVPANIEITNTGYWMKLVDKGDAATVAVGNTTTVSPGTDANVVNTGNNHEAVFDFYIPQGVKGDTGTISVGTVTTVPPESSASVVNSGTSTDAVFNFSIPRGNSATVAVGNVSTSPPGTNASVTNRGTSSAAVFDFVIPRGENGDGYTGAVVDEPNKMLILERSEDSLGEMAFIDDVTLDGKAYFRKDGDWAALTAGNGITVSGATVSATFASSGTPSALGTASHGSANTVARSDHVHTKPTYGNISTAGAITSDTAVANGDKIIVADASDSSKLIRTGISFDGSTTNKALTPKGTWESVSQPGHTHDDRYYTETEMDTKLNLKANLASPALTGTPTAPTAADGTNSTQIATTAFVQNSFKANDAMVFKGTIGSSGATVTSLPATHYQGWTYKVATAGTYAGQSCEIGDTIMCVTDGTSANDAHWTIIQANIDGAVTGPASATDAHVAVFNGTSGKVIKDSGFTIAKSVPSDAKFTDTTYTNGNGISLSGTTFSAAFPTSGTPADLGTASNGSSNNVARADHVHTKPTYGNISTAGAITATQTIANGDKLTIIDSSDSSKLTGSTITFDGSTATKALTQKGTWETFNNYSLPTASSSTKGGVKVGDGLSISNEVLSNSGVRSIATGSANGTISVNTNGTSANVSVKGLGSAAYTASTAYATANHTHCYFVKGTQTVSTGEWTGVLNEVDALYDGLTIDYWLPYGGSGNATLNLTLKNGTTTGAINCYTGGTSRLTTHIGQFCIGRLVYQTVDINGTSYTGWWLVRTVDTNDTACTTYRLGYYTADSVVYRYQMLFQKDNNTLTPLNNVNNDTGTSKTLLTNVEFDPLGFIFYYNSGTTINAGSLINPYGAARDSGIFDMRYTFNCGTSLTANKAIYLKTVPQSNGMVKLATGDPLVYDLPTSNDGFYYIFLGRTFNTYQIQLFDKHPVFYHDGTKIVEYHNLPKASSTTLGVVKVSTGLAVDSNGVLTNSGVRSIATGSSNGTISVNTNGTSANVSVKGLGTAAYTASTAYATATQGTNADNHRSNTSNPHSVTKSQVGLGNVANIDQSKAIKNITRDGTTFTMTALDGTTSTFTQQDNNTRYDADAVCGTAAGTAAKVASATNYVLATHNRFTLRLTVANTAQSALTLNVNSTGAKPIYINGSASSASNYTLPAGDYYVYYNGTNYYLRTDGVITGNITGNATGSAGTVTSVTIKAGTGISINDSSAITVSGERTITNAGVRSIATGSSNGTISVNTNGTSANVAVKGLGTAAYTASTDYTSVSVLPNDGGEIKTKYRVAQKDYANNETWYYPLAKLPVYNSGGNYASLIISGRIGGWVSGNMSYFQALVWNRDQSGIAAFDIAGTATAESTIYNVVDIVSYRNSDNTDTIYAKCAGYFTFDIDIELFQSSASILYDGTHSTTTPSGTLSAQASTSTKRVTLVNGKLMVGGTEAKLTDTTYTGTNGVSISGTTISNSGVRSIATGSANGTISVNTNGTSADVAVKGLGSAAYTASTAYAASSHTHSYLPLSGGTMTGQLKTSFKDSIAMGTYGASASTIPDLCEELRYSSGVAGSANITTAYTKDNITVGTGWYNFLWIPHRSGGVNGTASGDNCNYGSLYLSGMTMTGLYMIRYASSAIAEVKNIYKDTTYSASNGVSLSGTTFSNSGVRSIATGSANGTISVNTNGTSANVAVKGLGSAAYTESSAYAASGHTHSYLPLSGGTLTGDLLFSDVGTGVRQIRLTGGANDYGRIAVSGTGSNAGWMEIATADDANEPIYVRQYSGTYTGIARTLTLLDASGNTSMPGSLTVASQTKAASFNVNDKVTMQWNATDECLDFVFA